MKRKDYSQCHSSLDLFVRVMQNAIITFMVNERLIKSLEGGHYLYHKPLSNALSDNASALKVCHALMEIFRYCFEHDDCQGELLADLCAEINEAVSIHGSRIHQEDLKKHGRSFKHTKKQ